MSQFVNYEELAQRHNAAYSAFCSIYEAKNPPPKKPKVTRDLVSLLIMAGMILVMVASIVVSSSRTIEEFGGNTIGKAAFLMVEGGIMAYAFFRARRNTKTSKFEDARQLATAGLGLAFFVGIGANIDTSLKNHGILLPEAVKVIINLLVGFSAPVMAFISSDVLALEVMAGEAKRRQAETEYEALKTAWMEKRNSSWASQQKNWGVRVEISVPELSNGNSNGIPLEENRPALPVASTLGHSKAPDASKKVREYFQEHPEALELNPVEVAALLEVGKSTVYAIRKEYQSNGHGGE